MTTYQILSLLGLVSLVTSFITYLITGGFKVKKKVKALCLGVQAMLRSRMIEMYNRYSEKGWAPIYVKDDFNNCWVQYEGLGVNGVMSDIHKRFMALPTSPKKEENSK